MKKKEAPLTKGEYINEPELCKSRGGGDQCTPVGFGKAFSMLFYDGFAISDSEIDKRTMSATRDIRTRK